MLNISNTSISEFVVKDNYASYHSLDKRKHSPSVLKILLGLLLLFTLTLFLPWTQNIRSRGYVTTLNPFDKPQNIQALTGGRIKQWNVKEGDIVSIGDNVLILSEAKPEYLDPDLIANTKVQQKAKTQSADAYSSKKAYLSEQSIALALNRDSKLEQIAIYKQQIDIEIKSVEQELEAAKTYLDNSSKQLDRMQQMYDKGIKSLTDLETKRLSYREANAKKISLENKLVKLENDKINQLQEIERANADYDQKIAKIESEIQSADSYRFSLLGESNKLQSKINQLSERNRSFVITSPINGRITKLLKNGIGEFVKGQESIATIVPTEYQRAVELYLEPNDMPLVQEGKKVRLQFDGWPAIVFSGWPDNSFGTFGGRVFAIDNDISENGKYRILVVEDDPEKNWPDLIRLGSGARGLLLLNDVSIGYEIWRQLNGFPPDFYDPQTKEEFKNKAPIRKFK